MTEKNNPERRENERIDLEVNVDLAILGEYELSKLVNVSTGGAFIRAQKPKPIGTLVKLKFKLPGEKNPIEATGEVTWVYNQRGATDHNFTGIGIEFTQIDEHDRAKIKNFVEANS